MKRYSRKSTNIPISIFYEHFQLDKYNFDPPYQRDKNVWNAEQKSFLMDTIMKNFPMPPIFLEQKIHPISGKTKFDVIDGKQRLLTIIQFINNEVRLPNTFGNDEYGNEKMNGKCFNELLTLAKENPDIMDYISEFWSYVINVEYIENPDIKVVDNIFDRLNRGGERLNFPELRKANYYDTIMYQTIDALRRDDYFSSVLLRKLDKNRLEDVSFLTEIFILVVTGCVLDGFEATIDSKFKEVVDDIDEEKAAEIVSMLNSIKTIVQQFSLDYERFRITGVSHLYAIWYFGFYLFKNQIEVSPKIVQKLKAFFTDLRADRQNEYVCEYHKSMQSASKSKYSRKKRVSALLNYFGFPFDDNTD